MSKWYEVKITKVTVYAVEVEDSEGEEQAQQYAIDEAYGFDEVEVSPQITDDESIDRMCRHADGILSLDD